MDKTVVRELFRNKEKYVDQEVAINGWIRTNRAQKSFGFLNVNDGTFFENIQIVYAEAQLANFKDVQKYGVGAAVSAVGRLVATGKAAQPIEIQATHLELIGACPENFPIQPKRHTREFLRDVAHLRPRTNLFSAVFRVRSLVAHAIHSFFQEQHFVYVHTPIITASDGEGAGEMFNVTTPGKEAFFGQPVNLTVTGQLQGEAFAMAFHNIYTFGPTFRAEHSHTTRHAAEFWMIEPEIAFADLAANMALAEDMVKYIIDYLFKHAPEEMAFFNQWVDETHTLIERLTLVKDSQFKRLPYTEAIELLLEAVAAGKQFENNVEWGIDLATEHERYLTDDHFKAPIFVTDYPKDIKAFYMRLNDDGKTVAAMDMLVPGIGELIGGSQREERLDVLEQRMDDIGVPKDELDWYLDLRRYGGVKHAGFGLGFERMIMYVTGVENIRDVIPFPRTPNNAKF
ncbi:MAG: asparagine--tRNA ligase [Defluviitaleaceae bacterium]|nr:asparagine--tRNA ligase [Defluviitaleaceae bacterium]